MNELSDDALMRRYQDGDSDAFDQLFIRHARDLHIALCGLSGRQEAAAGLSIQTWQRVCRLRHAFDGTQPFRSWLFSHATYVRREQARPQSVTASQPGEPRPITDGASLLHALCALPDSYREVVVLQRYVGLTHAEIASVLGASEEAVLLRGRQGEQLLVQSHGEVPSKSLISVMPTTLDHIARSILPIVSQPRPSPVPLSLVLSCLVFGLGLVLLLVRLHR